MDHELSCQEFVELITEYLEGALTADNRTRFEMHVHHCEGCATYVDQMRQTIALMGKLTEGHISEQAKANVLRAFADWKREGH
jgi:anti-sigma factor RsiW